MTALHNVDLLYLLLVVVVFKLFLYLNQLFNASTGEYCNI